MAGARNANNSLIFVDTNILLDFYRLSGDSAERQLKALERHKDSLILTEQLRMEFLKNRQKVIFDTIKHLKKPDKITFPLFLSDYQPSKMVGSSLKAAESNFQKVQKKIDDILAKPSIYDNVYKLIMKLFNHKSKYTLDIEDKIRFTIRNSAKKRFILGYPPRKSTDTSIGDAVNWEWIVHCAVSCPDKRDIMQISRDNDYGTTKGNDSYLNDWLIKEFKQRVSRRRNISLTSKLTTALKLLNEQVTKEDETQEAEIILAER